MMLLAVYVALVILTSNDAKSHCSFGISKFGADRNQNEVVIDMDSLMDTQYSQRQMDQLTKEAHKELSPMKSKPQNKPKTPSRDFESVLLPESGAGARTFGNLRVAPDPSSTENTDNTEIPGVSLEPNTIPPVLRKLFLDHASNVTKRGFLSNVNLLHKSRKAQRMRVKPSSSWADKSISPRFGNNVLSPKIIPPLFQSLKDSKDAHFTPFCKRSAGIENEPQKQPMISKKQEKQLRKSRNVQDQERWKWEEWHEIRNPNVVHKREANSRRMRISDIWNKPKKYNSNHEEPVKIVLPLLLSDVKESKESRKPVVLLAPKSPGTERLHNPISGSGTTISESLGIKNFRVKSEGGKEFSFSASLSDVQQLLGLLAKPDSTLMLEKVSPDKGKYEKLEKSSTSGPNKKVTAHVTPIVSPIVTPSVTLKLVEKEWLASCTESTDVPDLKEIETNVLENVVQMDIPCYKATVTTAGTPTGTTRCPDGETSSVTATNGGLFDAE